MKHHDEWWAFKDAVWARLEMGEERYGDATFRKDPASITREIDEEILDVAAYAFMLWCRVKALRAKLPEEEFRLLDLHDAGCPVVNVQPEPGMAILCQCVAKLRRDLG